MTMRRALPAIALCLAAGCANNRGHAVTGAEVGAEAAPAPPAKEPAKALVPAAPKLERRSTGDIKRAELNAVLDGAPGRFLQHVETSPRFVGGRFRGWKLASFFPGDARFAAVDLQAGDVVLSVNGQSIEQPEQLMHVWESLRFERALVVAIERDGQPRELRFEIRD